MAVQLIYETHATTVDNERGLATGWLPGELSRLGREQAVRLGQRHADGSVATVYVSDLARAVETVTIAFAGRDVPVARDARLRECDYGDWNGQPGARIAPERPRRIDTPYPNGESYRDIVDRTRAFLRDVLRDHDGGTVLMVSHSANRWALDLLLRGIPLDHSVIASFRWQPGWTYRVTTDLVDG